MDKINDYLQSKIPESLNVEVYLQATVVFTVAFLLIGILGRFLFGKKSTLNHAISSSISILYIYVVTIAVYSIGVDLSFLISPLPFISMSGNTLSVFIFKGVHYTAICI